MAMETVTEMVIDHMRMMECAKDCGLLDTEEKTLEEIRILAKKIHGRFGYLFTEQQLLCFWEVHEKARARERELGQDRKSWAESMARSVVEG